MKTIEIENWKFGLDTRRQAISSQLGTLTTLENAFVNQGAEIESRKAFVRLGKLPTGCFDLLALPDSLVTFGSSTAPSIDSKTSSSRLRVSNVATISFATAPTIFLVGMSVTITGMGGVGYNGTFTITSVGAFSISFASVGANEGLTVDSGGTVTNPLMTNLVDYQRLRHPWVGLINDGLFDPAMNGVETSCCFDGKAFVSASFNSYQGSIVGSDYSSVATTLLFYDGTAIVEHYLGSVLVKTGFRSGTAADQLIAMASSLATLLPSYFGTDYVGNQVDLTSGGVTQSYCTITGPANQDFTISTYYTTETTKTFSLDATHGAEAKDPVTAIGATATFFFVGGSSGSINTFVDANAVDLIISAVNYNTTLLQTVIDLATAINTRTGTTGYTATASLVSTNKAQLVITATTADAATFNGVNLTINTTTIKVATASNLPGAAGNLSIALASGVTGEGATSQVSYLLFNGTVATTPWDYFDTWGFTLTANNIVYTVAAGNIVNTIPSYCFTMGQKVYFCSGTSFYFSEVSDATGWEQQDTGAGSTTVADQSFSPSDVISLANYQGRLAALCNRNIVIYSVNADPTQNAQLQNIQNIGVVLGGKLGVQSIGEEDVIFPSQTGWRSLRVRETTLNAVVTDIGSPIDSIVVSSMVTNGTDGICSVVEPTSNTFWGYLNGVIYVLSYFPMLKITAWSTFQPTFSLNGVQTTFTPVKFVVFNNQVYVLDSNNVVYLYGGPDNNTYDGAVVTVTTPWLDDRKPKLNKAFSSVDIGMSGLWTLSCGSDPFSGTLEEVLSTGTAATPDSTMDSTFDKLTIPYISNGTHFRMKAVSSATNQGVVKLSSLLINYEPEDTK